MSRHTTLALPIVAAIGILFFGMAQRDRLVAQPTAASPPEGLAGKLWMIETRPNGRAKPVFVFSPSIRVLGSQAFLVGTNTIVPDLSSDQYGSAAKQIWLPVSDIQSAVVYENANQIEGPRAKPAK